MKLYEALEQCKDMPRDHMSCSNPLEWNKYCGPRIAEGLTNNISLLQARDCDVSRESKNVWRRILGHRTTLRSPRDVSAPMIQVCAFPPLFPPSHNSSPPSYKLP